VAQAIVHVVGMAIDDAKKLLDSAAFMELMNMMQYSQMDAASEKSGATSFLL
jgi:hypothetical protein